MVTLQYLLLDILYEFQSILGIINIQRTDISDQAPDEYFCSICRCLLWKPRSCSLCLHLFCGKYIQIQIENPSSVNKCCQRRIILNQIKSFNRNGQPVAAANKLTHIESRINTIQLIEQQKQTSRKQNCGNLYHILIMLKFLLLNWSKIPFFIFILSASGFFAITIHFLILTYSIPQG